MAKRSNTRVKQARETPGAQRRSRPFDRRTRRDDYEPAVTAMIVNHQPDPLYSEGLSALADVLVLQMFDSGVGETLRMAYTIVQEHQERQNRRAMLSTATEALREHLARLDETFDEL